MRIAFVTEHFYPFVGGISEHTFHLAQSLAKNNEVFVFAPHYLGIKYIPLPQRPLFEIIRIGKATFFPANGSMTAFTYTPSALFAFKDYLKMKFDIIHIQGSVVPTLPLFASLSHTDAIKVVTFHAHHKKSIGYTLFKSVFTKALAKLDGFIAVSRAAKDTIESHFKIAPLSIIPNGIDTTRFTPYGEKIDRFNDGKFNILFVGRMEKRKGLDVLLKSLMDIETEQFRLIVVGDGPLMEKYKKQSKRLKIEVVFTGKVSPHNLSMLYRSSHIFVAPSTMGESFGIVLLEAMASGVPIIASSIDGYRETLKEGKYGILFENENVYDLRKKILYLYERGDLREKLSKKGQLYVKTNYSWDVIAQKTMDFYLSLLSKEQIKSEDALFSEKL